MGTEIHINGKLIRDKNGGFFVAGSAKGQGNGMEQALLLAALTDSLLNDMGMTREAFAKLTEIIEENMVQRIVVDNAAAEAQENGQ